jgi:ribosomal protein S18 acetylase RimI-like enzyme
VRKKLIYKFDEIPATSPIIEVYDSSGINRPTSNPDRIELMYANSNLVVTAWEEEKLVGIARSLTDYVYSCYLADLAIRKEYQKEGIGKELISLIGQRIGPQTSLILLSAPGALEYYPKIGFRKIENGFIIDREM